MQKWNELGQILTFVTYDILLYEVIKMSSQTLFAYFVKSLWNIKDKFMISDNMVWRSLIGLDGLLYLCIRPNYLQWEVAFLKVSESHEMSEEQVDFLCISTICKGIRKLNILPCNLHKINQGPLRLLQRKHIIMKIKLCWYR